MSKERMQKQREETLRKILDKAWDIAITDGLEGVSIRKVAAAMNFAPNNLYNYFENKNALLQCMKKDAYDWTFDIINKDKLELKEVRPVMEHISKSLLQCAMVHPQRYVVMTSDMILDDQEPMDKDLTRMVADMLDAGIKSGEIRQIDTVETAVNMRMIIIAFIRMVSSNENIVMEEAERMLDNLFTILFEGIQRREK